MRLSAVILTQNNEKGIERCLKSVEFCEEIILIVDSKNPSSKFQVPNKLQISNSKPVIKVFERELGGDFAEQRNFGMEKASGDWILFVDDDEEVTSELKKETQQVMGYELGVRGETVAYYLKRRDFFWGRELKYGETASARSRGIVRLVKKNSGKWIGQVHEEFIIYNSEFRIRSLNNYLNHYPHKTIKEFLESVNLYSSLRAQELYSQAKKTNILEIMFFPLGKFIYVYLFKLGFLDRSAGFVYAFFMSFHSFLVRAKLFQLWYYKNNMLI